MTTYTLAIEHTDGGKREAKAYSTPTNAIDGLERLRAGGVMISAILRDGLPINEDTLRADEEIGKPIDTDDAKPASVWGKRCPPDYTGRTLAPRNGIYPSPIPRLYHK